MKVVSSFGLCVICISFLFSFVMVGITFDTLVTIPDTYLVTLNQGLTRPNDL